jgi:putative transcriptional regulator
LERGGAGWTLHQLRHSDLPRSRGRRQHAHAAGPRRVDVTLASAVSERDDPRLDHEDRRVPQELPTVVKPTRVTNSIRSLRFANGKMTQAELVIAIEEGRYSAYLEMAWRIARVFGVPLDDVFQYPNSPEVTK